MTTETARTRIALALAHRRLSTGPLHVQRRRPRSLASHIRRRRSQLQAMTPSLDALTTTDLRPSTRLIVVYGYGCDVFTNDVDKRHKELNSQRNMSRISAVDVFCNDTEPKSMTYDIWKTLVRRREILEPTPFVERVMAAVCDALSKSERVLLLGHSYGGSVVSRVAMFLAAHCPHRYDFGNLQVATFGSIFIPPPSRVPGIAVKHFAFTNDIAKLCHKQSPTCSHVVMMPPRHRNPVTSHMDYDDMILDIARTGSIP